MPRIEHVHINISQNNQVRAHLLAKHRELSGASSAEKFVNPDGELRLRSDDEDKAIYIGLSATTSTGRSL